MRQSIIITIISILLVLGSCISGFSKQIGLSEEANISLVTCSVGNEVYALYGHSAIRVQDSQNDIDVVFNYGVFSFSQPNFVLRFAKGETLYMVAIQSYDSFLRAYEQNNRSLWEQKLLLSRTEKEQMFSFLLWNSDPKNREYLYNFFHDNCATRIRNLVENHVEGKIIFTERLGKQPTYRQFVNDYQSVVPWTNLGIMLLLGSPSDAECNSYSQMFLPDKLSSTFANSRVVRDGETRPLCGETKLVHQAPAPNSISAIIKYSPIIVMFIILILSLYLTFRQWRKSKLNHSLDYFLLIFNGIIGIVLLWCFFYSKHPALASNYNLTWALATNLLFAFLWMKKSLRGYIVYYWLFISASIIAFYVVALLNMQEFPSAIYLLNTAFLLRATFIYFSYQKNK